MRALRNFFRSRVGGNAGLAPSQRGLRCVGRTAGGGAAQASSSTARRLSRRFNKQTEPATDHAVEAVTTVVMGAQYLARAANDDGPRVAVISPALGGAFFYDGEVAARRIAQSFPSLDADQVRSAVGLMAARVRLAVEPPQARRRTWVHGWAGDETRTLGGAQ